MSHEEADATFELGKLRWGGQLVLENGIIVERGSDGKSRSGVPASETSVSLSQSLRQVRESLLGQELESVERRRRDAWPWLKWASRFQLLGLASIGFRGYLDGSLGLGSVGWIWVGMVLVGLGWLVLKEKVFQEPLRRQQVRGKWRLALDGEKVFDVSPKNINEVLATLKNAGVQISKQIDYSVARQVEHPETGEVMSVPARELSPEDGEQ